MMCLHVMVLPRLLSLPRPRKTLVHELSLHKASPPLSKAQGRAYAQGQGTVQVWARASIPASLYDKQQCKQQTPPTELKGDPTEQGDASTWPSPGRKACEADTEACLCTAELEAEAEGAKVTCGHTVSSSPAWAIVHPPPTPTKGPWHALHTRTHAHTRAHTHRLLPVAVLYPMQQSHHFHFTWHLHHIQMPCHFTAGTNSHRLWTYGYTAHT